MDGRGRALDNVFVERLWRSVKYEDVYLKAYDGVPELLVVLTEYFEFYNSRRPHQSLGYATPDQVYRSGVGGGACIVDKYPKPINGPVRKTWSSANPLRLNRPVLAARRIYPSGSIGYNDLQIN